MIAILATAVAAPGPLEDEASRNCGNDRGVGQARAELTRVLDQMSTGSMKPRKLAKALDKVDHFADMGWLCTREDRLHAGIVLVHSRELAQLEQAASFGVQAAEAQLPRADWVVTSAYDRRSLASGQGQIFGTQRRAGPNPCIYPFASTSTDADRKAWRQPGLQDLIAAYLKEQGRGAETPDQQTLGRLNLLCSVRDF